MDANSNLSILWNRFKWMVLAVVGFFTSLFHGFLRGTFDPPKTNAERFAIPEPPKRVLKGMSNASARMLSARALKVAKTPEEKAQVADLLAITDAPTRTAKLSEWLKNKIPDRKRRTPKAPPAESKV